MWEYRIYNCAIVQLVSTREKEKACNKKRNRPLPSLFYSQIPYEPKLLKNKHGKNWQNKSKHEGKAQNKLAYLLVIMMRVRNSHH